jgi:hypothetical protein
VLSTLAWPGACSAKPVRLTDSQLVRVPAGLTREQRKRFLQEDLNRALEYEPSAEEIANLPPVVIDLTTPPIAPQPAIRKK